MVLLRNDMLKGKRVFISGGAGVIGQALVLKLKEHGAIISVGDLKAKPKTFGPDIYYRRGDLNYITKEELNSFKPEYFFHLAATFERSIETWDFWDENYHHNIKLSHHLMTCLKDAASLQKVIFASSYLIYDPQNYSFKEKPTKPKLIEETDTINPRNTCGAAKLLHEIEIKFLENFENTKFETVSARIFRVYGRNSRDIISRWIRALLQNETITVYKEDNRFDYIFADDVAEGLILLATNPVTGVVNLGTGNSRSIKEVLEILQKKFPNMKTNIVQRNIPFEVSQANMNYFKQITGWIPPTTLEDGINQIIEFEKNQASSSKIQNEINVLVTSISKKIRLLKCLKNSCLSFQNNSKIIGADIDSNCIGKYFVDSFWHMPKIEELTLNTLIDYCKQKKISYIIPTRDGDLTYFSKNKNLLLQNNIHVMVSDLDEVEICLDKLAFYEKVKSLDHLAIHTSLKIDDIDSKYYVVKERFGAGSRNIGLKLSKNDAISFSKKLKKPVFQHFIDGKEVSVDLYVDKNRKTKGVIVRTRDLIVNGESQITETIQNPKLEKMCATLVEQLNLYGHVVMQVLITPDDGFHIIECNNRFGGASSLSYDMGLKSFYWFLLESMENNLDSYPFIRSNIEKKQIRYPDDLIV